MNHLTPTEPSETDRPKIKRSSGWLSVLPSLLTPVCIGLALYFLLAWAIKEGHIADEMVLRYLTGHAISKVTVGMFFIGAASLLLIAYNIFEQFSAEKNIRLSELEATTEAYANSRPKDGIRGFDEESDCAIEHGEQLLGMPAWTQTHYLWNRLVKTLHYIYRTGSVSGVEEEMKYLAELDLDRSHQRYSLARILIWATPMLGFLGTVLGISQALGGISPGPDNNFEAMMNGLQSNLYVAFDTTALALTLSMVLMFGQFLVERFEIQLLQLVDQRTRREISDHYDMTMASAANGSFEKIGREVLEATRDVVTNQTEIWKKTIASAEQAWTSSLTQTSEVVKSGLSAALEENVGNLADYLGQAIEKADQSVVFRWEQWQTMLSNNARLMKEHQLQMIEQTKTVHSLVGQIENASSFNKALDQQQAAIKATTDMHEVLAKVAREMSAQGKQLKKQTAVQAEMVKQSAELIDKSGEAYEAQKRRQRGPISKAPKTVPQNQKSTKISIAQAKALEAFAKLNAEAEAREKTKAKTKTKVKPKLGNFITKPVKKAKAIEAPAEIEAPAKIETPAPTPPPSKRRRDPNKPVMFIKSEEVTAIREKTAEPVAAAPTAVEEVKEIKVESKEVPNKELHDLAVRNIEIPEALKLKLARSKQRKRRSRPEPMLIKPRKSQFLIRDGDAVAEEVSEPQATISVDSLRQQKKQASHNVAELVMPDSETMMERNAFRKNLRIIDNLEADSAPRSKRAA